MTLAVGALLQDNRYQIQAVLGSTDVEIIYQAAHTYLNRTVILKQLRDDMDWSLALPPSSRVLMARLTLFAQCQHSGLGSISDCFEDEGRVYLVLPACSEPTLEQWLQSRGAIAPSHILNYLRPLVDIVEQFHHNDLIHGQLTPQTLHYREQTDEILVMDISWRMFIADFLSDRHRLTHTPVFDIRGLACIAYSLLTGDSIATELSVFGLGGSLSVLSHLLPQLHIIAEQTGSAVKQTLTLAFDPVCTHSLTPHKWLMLLENSIASHQQAAFTLDQGAVPHNIEWDEEEQYESSQYETDQQALDQQETEAYSAYSAEAYSIEQHDRTDQFEAETFETEQFETEPFETEQFETDPYEIDPYEIEQQNEKPFSVQRSNITRSQTGWSETEPNDALSDVLSASWLDQPSRLTHAEAANPEIVGMDMRGDQTAEQHVDYAIANASESRPNVRAPRTRWQRRLPLLLGTTSMVAALSGGLIGYVFRTQDVDQLDQSPLFGSEIFGREQSFPPSEHWPGLKTKVGSNTSVLFERVQTQQATQSRPSNQPFPENPVNVSFSDSLSEADELDEDLPLLDSEREEGDRLLDRITEPEWDDEDEWTEDEAPLDSDEMTREPVIIKPVQRGETTPPPLLDEIFSPEPIIPTPTEPPSRLVDEMPPPVQNERSLDPLLPSWNRPRPGVNVSPIDAKPPSIPNTPPEFQHPEADLDAVDLTDFYNADGFSHQPS